MQPGQEPPNKGRKYPAELVTISGICGGGHPEGDLVLIIRSAHDGDH